MVILLRKMRLLAICLVSIIFVSGCRAVVDDLKKESELEFTVVAEREIPETLRDVILEKKNNPFQISYTNSGELYIAVGYGKQETGGYSITVNGLYETMQSIVIDTTLLGPEKEEVHNPSYPYIVVKTESIPDKTIEFK